MNFDHLEATHYVQKLSWLLADANHNYSAVQPILLAPFTDLRSIQVVVQGDKLPLLYGAQDVSSYRHGAYTGEISSKQLAKLGCSYVLTSHTERRLYYGENDEVMLKKATRALEDGIKPILCIGEEDEVEREAPDFDHLFGQLEPIVQKINSVGKDNVLPFLENVVIAYEPRWAVGGTGKGGTCSPEFIEQVMSGLRAKISSELGVDAAENVYLVYGGSVSINSVADIVVQENVDGVLVGRASLDPEEFSKIIRVISKVSGLSGSSSSLAK
jgi:triosephosphate isomerase